VTERDKTGQNGTKRDKTEVLFRFIAIYRQFLVTEHSIRKGIPQELSDKLGFVMG
jgi:hypothetical protein